MHIHELPAQTTAADTDVAAIDNGTTTRKMTVANLGKKITEDATPAFTSGDSSEAASWTDVDAVTSGLPLKTILNRITTMMKNVRWLYKMLGTADISGLSDGTLTGALNELNTSLAYKIIDKTSGSVTFTANSNAAFVISLADVLPEGYRPCGIMFISFEGTYADYIVLRRYGISYTNKSVTISCRCLTSSSSVTATCLIYVLCVPASRVTE